MLDVRLYLAQRISAMVMAPLVLGHLAVMIYAVQDGLSAAEILGRTQGSLWWGAFYGLFALAASVHAAIGLRVVVHETLKVQGPALTRRVGPGDVIALKPEGIHSVEAADGKPSCGIHVYLAKLTAIERSLFAWDSGEAQPFTDENYDAMIRRSA